MINEPLVSILVPIYNRENMVAETLASAIKQSYSNIEIIAVDNCSTDNSYKTSVEFSNCDKRIKIFRNSENVGMIRNWERCLSNASGKYVAILCSDDLLHESFVEECVKCFEKNDDVDFVFTDIYCFNDVNETETLPLCKHSKIEKISKDKFVLDLLAGKNVGGPAGFLYRRDGLRIETEIENNMGYKDLVGGVDNLISLNAIRNSCIFIPKKLYYFRYHEKSITISSQKLYLKRQHFISFLHFLKNTDDDELKTIVIGNILDFELQRIKDELSSLYQFNHGYDDVFTTIFFDRFFAKHKAVLERIFSGCRNLNIGIFGIGSHSSTMFHMYKQIYGDFDFNIFFLDSNPSNKARKFMGYPVYSLDDIVELGLKKIIISSFMYQEEIYDLLTGLKLEGVELIKIYGHADVRLF